MTAAEHRTPTAPGDGLLDLVPIAALIVLVLNDHVLKSAWPGFITGKLSDVAGLVLAPVVLQASVEFVRGVGGEAWRPSRTVLALSTGAIAIGFVAAKTLEPAADIYRAGMGILQWPLSAIASLIVSGTVPEPDTVLFVRDPSDLVALPALGVALLVGQRRIDHAKPDRANQDRGHDERRENSQLDAY